MSQKDGPLDDPLAEAVGRHLGREIAASRTRRGWTQQELADAAGMSQSAIKNYELGHRVPRVDYLVVLARAVGADAGRWLDVAEKAAKKETRRDT